MILKCGYYAPSGHNLQTWQFTVIEKAEDIARLKEAAEKASKENNVNFYGWENPKVLVLVSNDNRNPLGCQDASNASENMMLAAHSLGLGSIWIHRAKEEFEMDEYKKLLNDIKNSHEKFREL